MRKNLALWGILIIALFLRTHNLSSNPAGFFCDEASIGYNAHSLLKTGRDEYGVSWPLFFRAFGEYKNPVMIYSTMPFIKLLGLDEFSVRLTSALYGVLGIVATFLLGKRIVNFGVGLASALFLAISPWHIHFSRVSLEGLMPFVFFTTLATYFWFQYWQEQKNYHFFASIILFAFALYSYFPARIFIPLFAASLAVIGVGKLSRQPKKILVGAILTIILINPLVSHMLSGSGFARWYQVRGDKTLGEVAKLYFNHFSLDFLFAKGDIDFPGQFITRHFIRGIGELYWFQLLLLIIGLFWVLKNINKNTNKVLMAWFLLYPLGTIFTDAPGPQATRSIIGVVPFQVISAIGLLSLWEVIKKLRIKVMNVAFLTIICLIIGFSVLSFFSLLKVYPLYSSDYWGWQYGPKEIVTYFLQKQDKYDQLIITGEFNAPHIFLKFYGQDQCQKCLIGDFSLLDLNKNQLFAIRPEDIFALESEYEFLTKKQVFYPNGDLAFKIGEVKEPF